MIDRTALLSDLKKQVTAVEKDLTDQLRALPEVKARLVAEYSQARKLNRTAATESAWLGERVTQVAVAWVLGTVFVRFCEDNHLIPDPYLTGPSNDRRDLAHARYDSYVESDPDPTYRGWLETAFAELGTGQAGKLLFDPARNPLYQIPVSHEGARGLIEFWRSRDEHGVLIHNFTDPLDEDGINGWDTRFLGDLYQDLSEDIRKNYALLQTPEFVEEFILDRTLTPAINEFGYAAIKLIDPTCGSGHFVLGAFKRLNSLWADNRPTMDRHERVRAALESVHGVDINPFAIAIARFRLLVAAMAAANIRTLNEAARYDWPIKLAIGDSLIKARQLELTFDGEQNDPLAEHSYATEDVQDYPNILKPGRYHTVVGNPPYIEVKDRGLKDLYRELYDACFGLYVLSVPFAQRFFELAKQGDKQGNGYGRVGQITANSFMKREFGSTLIEDFFAKQVELTEVIDTSGAYIPGHATPTIILIGICRSGNGRTSTIRTVRSVQGEPATPRDPRHGVVWRSIVENIDKPGHLGHWISVEDLDRGKYFAKQPWILLDGGLEMIEILNGRKACPLGDRVKRIGFFGDSHADDAFNLANTHATRLLSDELRLVSSFRGDQTRDWHFTGRDITVFPYDSKHEIATASELSEAFLRHFWRIRTPLWNRTVGTGKTYYQTGRPWWAWHQLPKDEDTHPWTIAYGEITTHNHFVLDRDKNAYNRTSPIIKLPATSQDSDYLALLGILNSSAACFWLKLVCFDKGNGGIGGGISDEFWEHRFVFNSSNLKQLPLPAAEPIEISTKLDALSRELMSASPAAIIADNTPNAPLMQSGKQRWECIRAQMITLQEELDWQVYSLYGLSEDLRTPAEDLPTLALGERAFELALADRINNGEEISAWFERHGTEPTNQIPQSWPRSYQKVVQRRIDTILTNRAIGMIERPEYKRRWSTESWDSLLSKSLRAWLLDRIESGDLWSDFNGQPQILTLSRLTDRLASDKDFVSVASLYSPRTEFAKLVVNLLTDEHVPGLAALRYKPSGLTKHSNWEHVWDLQRQEDAMPEGADKIAFRKTVPLPPKYTRADFLRPSFWSARGSLDVPKERFISYGTTNAATPDLYGWAGWDHREQAMAIAIYLAEHSLTTEEITPFLAALLELQPWLDQWHSEVDPNYGIAPSTFLSGDRRDRQAEHGLTDDDLRNWRPQPAPRGRRTTARTAKKKAAEAEGDDN
ncbi:MULTISPECIES: BREX-2 system adenine-specific DNA-methyltransferase PglX [unclassified Nocardia]|uniref:BREX-2 system adenine-specific DNA-methyltransferase PglX n=1 Tax=unclassified Nocardia TaxID=2637762 RepID=UPI0033AE9306